MTQKTQSKIIELPSCLDANSAELLLVELNEALEKSNYIKLIAEKVTHVSTLYIQLLLAASAEVKTRNGEFTLLNPSDALKSALQDLGLGKAIQILD